MTTTLEPSSNATTARWPDVMVVPKTTIKARIARRLFESVVDRLEVRVVLPDGRTLGTSEPAGPVMSLHRPEHFYRRVGAGGLIGFGESYMAGDWTADDLAGVLTVFARQLSSLVAAPLQRLRAFYVHHEPRGRCATVANTRANISHHYDLSNDLFSLFLDPTMTYSSAIFAPGAENGPAVGVDELAQAQHRKIDRLLDQTGVRAGSRVLEIGTGWGELAIRAAARGATVHSVTLSQEQRELAQQRIAEAGLSDRVSVELRDYRQVTGQYDAVLSIEMIEAVGYQFWPDYFRTLDARLAPGGRIGLQAITMPHDRMLASRGTYTWIIKYIFPGSFLPSVTVIEANLREHTGLHVVDRYSFARHYARTLRTWRSRFDAAAAAIDNLGFDEIFRRMWQLYLAYSEAGFTSGYLDVYQFVLARDGVDVGVGDGVGDGDGVGVGGEPAP